MPGVTEQPEPGLNSRAPGSLSIPGSDDGLCAQSGLTGSAFEGAVCLHGPWGLLGTDLGARPCDVGEDTKPCVPELPLLDVCDSCWCLIGLGDLLCREGPLTRGLDGAVEENLAGEGLRLEQSDSLQGPARLVVASFLTFLRNLGLSWDLRPPPVPLEATEAAVRGRGTGVRLV